MQRYNPKEIEPRWQAKWEADKIYQVPDDAPHAGQASTKPKKYILEYFPYPSGAAMHVGHVRNYTIGDVLARFNRMQGFDVLHPMGWDGFGLPAENYAIKTGISPRQAIDENTAKFKQQLMQMGFSYDWSREIDSTDPKYYRWTQWLFELLFKRGLAYQQESLQWWCPNDKTVLANEQVEGGKCWRCGFDVEKKSLKQWFFKITDYADRLSKDLDDVDWSDAIKAMQRNWIGRSQGTQIEFAIDGHTETLTVFTTRPDTLYGATFIVLSPEHPLVAGLTTAEHKQHVTTYQKAAESKSDIERQETNRDKTGAFTGAYAINPVSGEKIPIWIADYVLMGYGTGAIMAVPAHDERDYAFAKKFALPVIPVVSPIFGDYDSQAVERPTVLAFAHDPDADKYCMLQWKANPNVHGKSGLELPGGGINDGESTEQAALREFAEETGYTDASVMATLPVALSLYYTYNDNGQNRSKHAVKSVVVLRLNSLQRDESIEKEAYEADASTVWLTKAELFSKDFYPLDKAAIKAVFEYEVYHDEGVLSNSGPYNNMLTAEAREKIVADLEAKGSGHEVTNYRMRDWLISRQRFWGAPIPIIHCPKDGAVAVPEDQLPVKLPDVEKFEASFFEGQNGHSPLANIPEFVNTTCPTCGGPAERETDTMDGFACSSWYFLRFADPHNDEQAFDKDKVAHWLPVDDYIGGAEHAVMHLLYARFWTKVMHDAGLIDFDEPFNTLRNHGMILAPDGAKMSKSKGNTIEPSVLIDQGYGADSVRIMELFIGPWNQSAAWSVEGMGGAFRFLQRVWTLVQEHLEQADESLVAKSDDLQRATHKATKKVTDGIADMSFNTAIASMMELVNDLYKLKTTVPIGAPLWRDNMLRVVQLLAPFAPHIAEELWQQLGQGGSVHKSDWPSYDAKYLVSESMTIVVQVNGKLRGQLSLPTEASEAEVITAAQADEKVKSYLAGQAIRKTIYVPGKLVNFVI